MKVLWFYAVFSLPGCGGVTFVCVFPGWCVCLGGLHLSGRGGQLVRTLCPALTGPDRELKCRQGFVQMTPRSPQAVGLYSAAGKGR